jgi:hypothetical protein
VKKHRLVFANGIQSSSIWGAVCVKPRTDNNDFSLIAADGFLIKRRSDIGVWTEAPVFEIPIKSRYAYWRYINDKGNGLQLTPELTDYLFKEEKTLITKRPRAIARSWFLLNGGIGPKYLPNPVAYELKRDNKGRSCFDIRVPESALFPVT